MIGIAHPANTITYVGIAAAAAGLALAPGATGWAVVLLIVAGVCDLFDGAFARRFKRDEQARAFGVQLDSLADMVSFVALPIAILVATRPPLWLAILVSVVYAAAAVTRLAFFNVTTDGTPADYRGVPVTYAALVLPLVWLVVHLAGGAPALPWAIALAVLAVGFVVDVRVPKPRGVAYIAFGVLAVVLVAGLVWLELT